MREEVEVKVKVITITTIPETANVNIASLERGCLSS
jgi:hypothetical protein